jgi:long-chain fatty acid transport protein
MRALLVVASVAFVSSPAWAGGLAVSDQDAMASGRSGTGIGVSGNASAIYFNPAGLGDVKGLAMMAGATVLLPTASAADPATGASTSTLAGPKVPPHVYAAWGTGRFTVGAGFNAPFGGGLSWPTDWSGNTELTQMQLQVLAGHLGGAWRINEQWSIGANFTVYGTSVLLEKRIDFVATQGQAQLGGSGVGFGGQAGVRFAPTDRVRLGLMARLPAAVSMAGRASFSDVPSSFQGTLPDQAITTRLVLPAKVALGGDFQLPWFRLLADVEYTCWSSFQSFTVDFEQPQTPDVTQPRNWQNAPTFRLGGEREFGKVMVRLGALLDLATSPADTLSPSLPDSTRLGGTAGVGYDFGDVRADLAYQFVAFLPRTPTGDAFPATYNASAHVFALSVTANAFR